MAKKTAHDLRQQIGQLLIFGFDGLNLDAKLRTTLHALQPGGVVLFARNIETPLQTWELLRNCQSAVPTPMFLCLDLEGGTVDRLRNAIAPAPSAEAVFHTGSRKLFRMHGNILGLEAKALGFNTDFAPVLDLALPASCSVLTSRAVSPDASSVIRYAGEFLRGLKDANVLGCGKHFPGLGEARFDSHIEKPVIRKTIKDIWAEDLLPYQALHKRLPFIMVSHAAYPDVTQEKMPASLSRKWIDNILRKRIGYRGIIVSDDLEMGGIVTHVSIEDAAVESLRAGADMFLVSHNQEAVWRSFEAVLHEAEKKRRFAEHVAQAAARVVHFKKRAPGLRAFPKPPKALVVQTLKKIVTDFSRIVAEIRA